MRGTSRNGPYLGRWPASRCQGKAWEKEALPRTDLGADEAFVFATAPDCVCSRAPHGAEDLLRFGVSCRNRAAASAASLAASAYVSQSTKC